ADRERRTSPRRHDESAAFPGKAGRERGEEAKGREAIRSFVLARGPRGASRREDRIHRQGDARGEGTGGPTPRSDRQRPARGEAAGVAPQGSGARGEAEPRGPGEDGPASSDADADADQRGPAREP